MTDTGARGAGRSAGPLAAPPIVAGRPGHHLLGIALLDGVEEALRSTAPERDDRLAVATDDDLTGLAHLVVEAEIPLVHGPTLEPGGLPDRPVRRPEPASPASGAVSPSIKTQMPTRHVVVDGSNIATEGRSLPSLVQLDVAVREYRREFPEDVITVVVDATFGHRIDPSERTDFDEAVAHNEIVSPPAGAIGRGDAFLLRVAEKVGATVLSNDSFQEFHGEHDWLFNNDRLIGGKPVPGVGWIFTPRTPVRGPKSRDSMRDARRAKTGPKDEIKKVQKAIAVATEEAVEPDSPKVKRRRRSRGGAPPAEPVNDPLPFIEFVAAHPLGSPVDAEVESFSSHGAFVTADGLRCYIPLTGLGDPAPRAAKEVLKRGETRQFVLQALDPPRRGIELALPEFAQVSGAPTAETVEEEIKESARRPKRRRGRGRSDDEAAVAASALDEAVAVVPTDVVVAVHKAAAEVGDAAPAPTAKKTVRGRKAAPDAAAGAPDAGPVGKLAAAPPAGGRRSRSASRSTSAGEGPAPAAPTTDAPSTATGPRKRPARPRAGAPRAEPAAAPTPLSPVETAESVPETPAAPSVRKRTPRKAVAASPAEAVPAAALDPAPTAARPARRRGAAPEAPAAPAVADPAPPPARRSGRKAAAAAAPGGSAVADAPPAAAKRSSKRAVVVAPAPAPARKAAAAPVAGVEKQTSATKAAPRRASTKKAPAAATPAAVRKEAPVAKKPVAKKVAGATKAVPRKAAAPRSPRKRGADLA